MQLSETVPGTSARREPGKDTLTSVAAHSDREGILSNSRPSGRAAQIHSAWEEGNKSLFGILALTEGGPTEWEFGTATESVPLSDTLEQGLNNQLHVQMYRRMVHF